MLALALLAASIAVPLAAQESEPEQPSATAPAAVKAVPLAFQQGRAESAILNWVLANSGPLKGETTVGTLRVAFTITPAEGWWDKAGGGKLAWHDAPADNFHLRIFVADAIYGRLIPGLAVHATLIDGNGNQQVAPIAYGWYPLINAYGGNVPLASAGEYRLRVLIEAPPELDATLPRNTTAEFPALPITTDALAPLRLATAASTAEAALLKPEIDAYGQALTALWQSSTTGEERADGDYFVAYALAGADDWKRLEHALGEHTASEGLAIVVRDSRTGRPIPELVPHAVFAYRDGRNVNAVALALTLSAGLAHYSAATPKLQADRSYTLQVSFEAPGFRRWGRESARFATPGHVEFPGAGLKPPKQDGRK